MAVNNGSAPIVELPIWYYRQFPVDYSLGPRAAEGFLGWAQYTCRIPLAEMALVLMHIENVGFECGPVWGPDAPDRAVRDTQEWVARCVHTFSAKLPPIIDAAREARMTIVHVAGRESLARHYPAYERTLAEVTTPEPKQPEGAIRPEKTDMPGVSERLGPMYAEDIRLAKEVDFPAVARPRDGDLLVVTTHQLNTLLRNRRIWHLTYCGFAINWCLWHSQAGMVDMNRLGYTCGCIRQATVANETKESAATMANHAYAMWHTADMFGFVVDDYDFITTCKNLI